MFVPRDPSLPLQLLALFTGKELQQRVCGSEDIDVELLKEHTIYEECDEADEHIQFFWDVLRNDFSQPERSNLIQFIGATKRLYDRAGWPEKYKLTIKGVPATGSIDGRLPRAYTCFFRLHLPAYSSAEVMCERLRTAMTSCKTLDGEEKDEDEDNEEGAERWG